MERPFERPTPGSPEAGRGKEGIVRESMVLPTLISDFQPPDCVRINFCCFKPSSLWDFVEVALGNTQLLNDIPYTCITWFYFFFYIFNLFFIETELIYNVVLVLGIIQQSDSILYTYMFLFIFFTIMGYCRILNIVPCATQ